MTLRKGLPDHSFFSGFTDAQRTQLRALAQEVTFEANEVILVAGERSKDFYVLASGSVGVDVVTRSYTVRVQALGRGDAFGWSSLLDDYDTLFQVRARERCTALRLDGSGVTSLCREDPAFGVEFLRAVLRTVAGRVHGAETRLAELCGVEERSPKTPIM
jgi:CRP-like cAMP-binding protein